MWVTLLYDGLAFLLSGPLNCELCFYKKKKEVVESPLPSQGPTNGHKCYVSPEFSGFPTRARGDIYKVATSPQSSRGPTHQRKCYVSPAFWGVPSASAENKLASLVIIT